LGLDGTGVLEVHDDGAVQFTALRNAEIFGEFPDRADPFQRNYLGAVHMASAADFIGDAADFEGMRMHVLIGDEASHPGNAHQNSLIAQFAQRAVRGHARHAKGFDDVVFRRNTRRCAPLAGTDIVENMPLYLQIQRLQRHIGPAHAVRLACIDRYGQLAAASRCIRAAKRGRNSSSSAGGPSVSAQRPATMTSRMAAPPPPNSRRSNAVSAPAPPMAGGPE